MAPITDQKFNLKFVDAVKKYPCLYNTMLSDYSRRDITQKAWDDVGKIVNLSGQECKEKWKNLRAVLTRHMKPIPNASCTKRMKPYYLADAMQFAVPFIRRVYNDESEDVTQEPVKIEIINDDTQLSASKHQMQAQSSIEQYDEPATSPQSSSPRPWSSLSLPYQKNHENIRSHEDDSVQSSTNYSKRKRSIPEEDKEPQQEANKMFLLSLLPDVNRMSAGQIRKFKRKVLELIDEIDENTISDP